MKIWVLQDAEVDLVLELLVAEQAVLEHMINKESHVLAEDEVAGTAIRLDAIRALRERMEEN
jgi:hypothetical protein